MPAVDDHERELPLGICIVDTKRRDDESAPAESADQTPFLIEITPRRPISCPLWKRSTQT